MTIASLQKTDAQIIAAQQESYLESGCETRGEYLVQLADEYCVSLSTVRQLAAILGPNEDFDGLVTSLEDMEGDEFE